jgi:hypothetical protein
MPSHAVSVTYRRLTCGPKFISVVFSLSGRFPNPDSPFLSSLPESELGVAACGRGGLRARKQVGAAASGELRAEAARSAGRGNRRARRSCARCGRGAPARSCESPNPGSRGGLRRPIPLLPPRIRARRGGLRRTLNPRQIRARWTACAAAWWWCASAQAQLCQRSTCPDVETLVRGAVTQKLQETFNAASGTLRLFFDDCFVRVRTPSVVVLHARLTPDRSTDSATPLPGLRRVRAAVGPRRRAQRGRRHHAVPRRTGPGHPRQGRRGRRPVLRQQAVLRRHPRPRRPRRRLQGIVLCCVFPRPARRRGLLRLNLTPSCARGKQQYVTIRPFQMALVFSSMSRASSPFNAGHGWPRYGSVLLTRCPECERPEPLVRLISKRSENGNFGREFVKCESKPRPGKVCLCFADYYLF